MQDWKIVNSSKYSLSCCTNVFHRCTFVLAFSVLAFSTLACSYLRIPYLHIPSSGTFVFRTCVFSRPCRTGGPWKEAHMPKTSPICSAVLVELRLVTDRHRHRPMASTYGGGIIIVPELSPVDDLRHAKVRVTLKPRVMNREHVVS